MTEYQVVAEMAAHVEVHELGGNSVQTFYKGAPLPEGVPQWRIKDLLGKHVIAPIGEVPVAPNAAVEQDPARGLDSVTPSLLQGEKPEEPRTDPALAANEAVGETVTREGRLDKVTEPSAEEKAAEAKRAEAQSKLPADGSLPDGRAGKDVWVEWLAANGYDYDEVSKVQEKSELTELAKKVDADRKS